MFHLPAALPQEAKVINKFIGFLEDLRNKPFGLHGFTASTLAPAAFIGYWRLSTRTGYSVEKVVLVIIDFELGLESDALRDRLASIKAEIQRLYKKHTGQQQDEIWMIAHPIVRLV